MCTLLSICKCSALYPLCTAYCYGYKLKYVHTAMLCSVLLIEGKNKSPLLLCNGNKPIKCTCMFSLCFQALAFLQYLHCSCCLLLMHFVYCSYSLVILHLMMGVKQKSVGFDKLYTLYKLF